MSKLPEEFVSTTKIMLGESYDAFECALSLAPGTSIRFNPYKQTTSVFQIEKNRIPWTNHGYYLDERPIFTLDPIFHTGAYYVQEASSMAIIFAIKQWIGKIEKPLKILDLCAAPGGKTTALTELGKSNLIVANEVIRTRYSILNENFTKWGTINKITTNHDVVDFTPLNGFFDVVLVDAPCSGEGLFRKDKKAREEWSPDNVQLCSVRQKRILAGAQQLVKPGGILVYCTCTYNRQENGENVSWLQDEFDFEGLSLEIPSEWGIEEQIHGKGFGYQFFPHRLKGEGFFLSGFRKTQGNSFEYPRIRKKEASPLVKANKKTMEFIAKYVDNISDYQLFMNKFNDLRMIDSQWFDDAVLISKVLSQSKSGIEVGAIKQENFIPSHDLAMAWDIKLHYPKIVLDRLNALRFLKREEFKADFSESGWHLVQHHNLNLGWVKVLPKRINNYLPKNLRIRMDLPA